MALDCPHLSLAFFATDEEHRGATILVRAIDAIGLGEDDGY